MSKKTLNIGYGNVNKIQVGHNLPLIYIGGPCAISEYHSLKIEIINKICSKLNFP